MSKRLGEEKQIERQWRILNMIAAGRATKRELIDTLHVTERTIERDITILSLAEFPIILVRSGRQRVYRFIDGYHFPRLELDLQERLALMLAKDIASFLEGTPYFTSLSNAVQKLGSSIPPRSAEYFQRTKEILAFHLKPAKDYQRVVPFINDAEKACRQQNRIELKYQSSNTGEVKLRKIDPYAIAQEGSALRLVAYCHLAGAFREFAFDNRMISLKVLDETFERDPNFDIDAYLSQSFGGMKGKKVEAIVRVYPPASRWIKEKKWPGLQKIIALDGDVIEMHFITYGREGLMRWALHWGQYVEVLSPQDFREEIKKEIEATRTRY